jgi:hypothetical protein
MPDAPHGEIAPDLYTVNTREALGEDPVSADSLTGSLPGFNQGEDLGESAPRLSFSWSGSTTAVLLPLRRNQAAEDDCVGLTGPRLSREARE